MKIILQNLKFDPSNFSLINKPGVYLITNLINGKKYVGSSAIMLRRLKEYLNPLYLERNLEKGNSKLLRALLKYGYSNFEFKVLEMFEHPLLPWLKPSHMQGTLAFACCVNNGMRKRGQEGKQMSPKAELRMQLLAREQYFLDKIKPEYNINLKAGSNLGRSYSEEVRKKMSVAKLGKVGNKKGAILSAETRDLMRENSGMNKNIVMLNENDKVLGYFKSIQLASEALGISRNRISRCARGIRKEIREKGKIYKFKFSDEE
jgi:group I intron endonuclease